MITGPQGPFSNIPPAIEAHVELIADTIQRAEQTRRATGAAPSRVVIEATPEAEKAWGQECERVADGSLFKETASWIFGSNVKGKKYALRFYFGGLAKYHAEVQRMVDNGYQGLKPLQQGNEEKLGTDGDRLAGGVYVSQPC